MEQKLTKEEREDMERRKYTNEEEKDELIPNLRYAVHNTRLTMYCADTCLLLVWKHFSKAC